MYVINLPSMPRTAVNTKISVVSTTIKTWFCAMHQLNEKAKSICICSFSLFPCLSVVSKEDHSNSASFVCVFLSHGDDGVIYGTDGFEKFENLTKYLKGNQCRSLLGKPKLFFIQVSNSFSYCQLQHGCCTHPCIFILCFFKGMPRYRAGWWDWDRQCRGWKSAEDSFGGRFPVCFFYCSR